LSRLALADPISKLAEELAGHAVPGGGLIVSIAGIVGGVAATDHSAPRVSMHAQPTCDPIDLDCYRTTVDKSDPVSLMGGWVPDWWVGMSAALAGIVAAVLACALILAYARLSRPPGAAHD
jgi:hypothetical protein